MGAAGIIDQVYPGTNYVRERGSWVATACMHQVGIDIDHGAVTVQLMPYADTPNRGGVYKAWATPVEDYAGDPAFVPSRPNDSVNGEGWSPGNAHGFIPASSKTDNFMVRQRRPYDPPRVLLEKFHDANMNGVADPGEEWIIGWPVAVKDPTGVVNWEYTPAEFMVTEGWWTTQEAEPEGTLQTVAMIDGVPMSLYPTANPILSLYVEGDSGEFHTLFYGNVGLGKIVACKAYDRDADGVFGEYDSALAGWTFQVTGTAVTGEAVGPLTLAAGGDGCARFADLLPGTYVVDELLPTDGPWYARGPTQTEVTITSMLQADAVLTGGIHEVGFTNYCVGTVDFGTKGYWHNRNGLREMSDDDIGWVNQLAPYASASSYFEAGDEPFDGYFADGTPVDEAEAAPSLAPMGSPRAEISAFLVDSNAGGDPREQLAQQLLAFVFNTLQRLGGPEVAIRMPDGSFFPAGDLIDLAIEAWEGMDGDWQRSMSELLDAFNNGDAAEHVRWEPCAIP
ncbi:MAG: hypothetical protein CMN30_32745 [Sandaracinus sp.]|mgnify:CR=1 FL=1|nr:hypothetical protein [Sandaracinus sp.]